MDYDTEMFAKIAIRNGLISQAALVATIDVIERDGGEIAEICVSRGYLSRQDAKDIERRKWEARIRDEGLLYEKVIKKNGYSSDEQIEHAKRTQQKLFAHRKESTPSLSEILKAQGAITKEQKTKVDALVTKLFEKAQKGELGKESFISELRKTVESTRKSGPGKKVMDFDFGHTPQNVRPPGDTKPGSAGRSPRAHANPNEEPVSPEPKAVSSTVPAKSDGGIPIDTEPLDEEENPCAISAILIDGRPSFLPSTSEADFFGFESNEFDISDLMEGRGVDVGDIQRGESRRMAPKRNQHHDDDEEGIESIEPIREIKARPAPKLGAEPVVRGHGVREDDENIAFDETIVDQRLLHEDEDDEESEDEDFSTEQLEVADDEDLDEMFDDEDDAQDDVAYKETVRVGDYTQPKSRKVLKKSERGGPGGKKRDQRGITSKIAGKEDFDPELDDLFEDDPGTRKTLDVKNRFKSKGGLSKKSDKSGGSSGKMGKKSSQAKGISSGKFGKKKKKR
ncbi:MAG: hypothetical protein NUW37_18465 [Planctomycetes bacterium]|nr:hypothetical protein [Planctomycetota bacterium]